MSGKSSIKPIQASAYYYSVDPTPNPSDKIRIFFSRLFHVFHAVDDIPSLVGMVSADTPQEAPVILFDMRGGSAEDFEAFLIPFLENHSNLGTCIQMALVEQSQPERIIRLAEEGWMPRHVLLVPWGAGVSNVSSKRCVCM